MTPLRTLEGITKKATLRRGMDGRLLYEPEKGIIWSPVPSKTLGIFWGSYLIPLLAAVVHYQSFTERYGHRQTDFVWYYYIIELESSSILSLHCITLEARNMRDIVP